MAFRSVVEELADPSDLEQEGNIWINSLLLEQEVVGLVEVLEGEIVLRELAQVHDRLARHVELHSSPQSLLVPLENHVHQHFELGGPLLRAGPGIVCRWTRREWVVLRVAALEHDFSLVEAAAMDQRIEAIEENCALRKGLCLTDHMLTRNLYCTSVEVGQEWTEFLEVRGLVSRVDGGEQEVSEVLQSKQSLQNASLSCALFKKVG